MAASVITNTVDRRKSTQDRANKIYRGTTAVAAGDYATSGIPCSFAVSGFYATKPPLLVRITGLTKYTYKFAPGTTKANGLFLVFDDAGEVAAGAMPAAVVADTITFEAVTTV